MKVYTLFVAATLMIALDGTAVHAQLYWDISGNATDSTAGGATPAGTWDSVLTNWNTDPNDTAGALTTWNNTTAYFSAAADATGTFAVTLDSTAAVQTDGINFEEGTVTISGGVGAGDQLVLNNSAAIDVATGLTATISSIVGGFSGLNKSGDGTLSLSGANTYSGTTNVNAGILAASNATALGAVDSTVVASGATLQVSGSGVSMAEPIGIVGDGFGGTDGALRKTGSGTTTLTGGVALNGDSRIHVDAGTLTISTTAVSGTGALTKTGAGTLTLSGAQAYFGLTTVNAGILGVSNATGLGSTSATTVVNAGGTLQVSGGVTIAEAISITGTGSTGTNGALRKTSNNTTILSGSISGDGLIAVTTGVLRLSSTGTANANFTGPITVSGGGTLRYEFLSPNQTGTTGLITLNNGILENTNGGAPGNGSMISSTRDIFLDTLGGTFLYNTAGGLSIVQPGTTISGPGGLTKTGVGVVSVAEAATYAGPTHVVAGTLRVRTSNNRYPTTTALTVDAGATFDVDNLSQTVGSLTGAGTVDTGSGTFISGADNSSTTFSGQILETGATGGKMTKQGTGTLTLSGNNLYTGLTTISTTGGAGAIAVQSNTALGTTAGSTTVASGAQLQIDGSGLDIAEPLTISGTGLTTTGAVRNLANNNTVSGAIALAANSRIQSSAGTLTISGTIKSSSTTSRNLTVGGAGDTTIDGIIGDGTNPIGSLTKADGGTLTLTGANIYTGNTTVTGGILSISNAFLPDASDVLLSTSTILNLIFAGAPDTIDSLFLNGTSQATGTWGATGSGATNINDTFFTGTGTLLVSTLAGVPGDFNNNGFVDAADYVLWSRGRTTPGGAPPGTPALPANEVSTIGTTDNQDHTDWRARFGNPTPGAGGGGDALGAGQVPEPSTAALLVLGLSALALGRRRCR